MGVLRIDRISRIEAGTGCVAKGVPSATARSAECRTLSSSLVAISGLRHMTAVYAHEALIARFQRCADSRDDR